MDIEQFSKLSLRNKGQLEVEQSGKCSCYYCLKVSDIQDIEEYAGDQSALCPHCGIDAVIPGVISHEVLVAAMKRWFTGRAGD